MVAGADDVFLIVFERRRVLKTLLVWRVTSSSAPRWAYAEIEVPLRVGHYSRSETLTEHDVIRKKPKFLGCCLDAVFVEEPSEPLPRMFVLGVVVVRQHRGAHVPLEVLQRQVAPRVAWRGSSARGEPPLLVQREAASVSKFSELMHDKGEPPPEVLDKFLDFLG